MHNLKAVLLFPTYAIVWRVWNYIIIIILEIPGKWLANDNSSKLSYI